MIVRFLLVFAVLVSASSGITLEGFSVSLVNDQPDTVVGLYVDNLITMRVIQQPLGKSGFVSSVNGIGTEFGMVKPYHNIGILAHNFSSGKLFTKLNLEEVIYIIYGDGRSDKYIVTSIVQYQALSPSSVSSKFKDLESKTVITASELFSKVYTKNDLVLQTCISKNGEASWGRLFVTAKKL